MISVVFVSYSHSVSLFPGEEDNPAVMDFLKCDGTELSLEYCKSNGFEIVSEPTLGIVCANSCDDNY